MDAAWNRPTVRLVAAATVAGLVVAAPARGEVGAPDALAKTGLYADWRRKTIARENLAFAPQYPLWSDGAGKRRYIFVPPGTSIDASNPDTFVFPVGTKFWKEFTLRGRRIETRYLERRASGWVFASYVWSEDESRASLAPVQGVATHHVLAPGITHAIPAEGECRACHEGRAGENGGAPPVLGFTALQLSPDRDPLALHIARSADELDLNGLVARGVVTGLPRHLAAAPPRIAAATPAARAALGYLDTNCGICHNGTGALASLGMILSQAGAPPGAAGALATTLGQPSRFRLGDDPAPLRIAPGRPDASTLLQRMRSRHPVVQMPPLGTRLVDAEAVALLERFITELSPSKPQALTSPPTTETRP
jgi:hypothetical protein